MAVGSYRPGPDMIGRCMYLVDIQDDDDVQCLFFLPVDMIGKKRNIQQQGKPFTSEEEENVEEGMQEVLGENKRV